MSTKGYLADIEFIELLRIISKHDGKLGIWHFESRRQFDFFFKERNLIYLLSNGNQIKGLEEIQKIVESLVPDRQSYYAFQKELPPIPGLASIISVKELLSSVLQSKSPVEYNDEVLPNAHTRFESVNKAFTPLKGELGTFWEDCFHLLVRGSSIEQIAAKLNIDIDEARRNFHKLRVVGMVKPVRAFSASTISSQMSDLRSNLSLLQKNIAQVQANNSVLLSSAFSGAENQSALSSADNSYYANSANESVSAGYRQTSGTVATENYSNAVSEPVLRQNSAKAAVGMDNSEVRFTAAERLSAIAETPTPPKPPTPDISVPPPAEPMRSEPKPRLPEEKPQTSDAKPPIFAMPEEKQGVLKRMLSALFSRN